jgi:hypothetical protein
LRHIFPLKSKHQVKNLLLAASETRFGRKVQHAKRTGLFLLGAEKMGC